MRILITTAIFPPDIGGPATYLFELTMWLASRNHQVIILTLGDGDESFYPGLIFSMIMLPRGESPVLRFFRSLIFTIRFAWSCDIIYSNGFFLQSAIAAKLLRKPLVIKVVGDDAWERAQRWGWTKKGFEQFQKDGSFRNNLLKKIRNFPIKSADLVIVPSLYLKHRAEKWTRLKRIEVVYNAIEDIDITAIEEEKLSLPEKTRNLFKVVTACRLVKHKHVDLIIKAIADIPESCLLVAGDGPEYPQLVNLTKRLNLEDRVFFLGTMGRIKMLKTISLCDVFVLNSSYEGLPHILLEVPQTGIRIIATNVGGTPEIIDYTKNAILIPPLNLSGLKRALMSVKEESASTRFRRFPKKPLGSFSFHEMMLRTESLFFELLKK